MTTRLFLQISIHTGRSYVFIHTGWYVCSIRNMRATSRNPERRGALVGGKPDRAGVLSRRSDVVVKGELVRVGALADGGYFFGAFVVHVGA
jgi:hypothetical protein